MMLIILLSRIFGLLRSIALAYYFGQGIYTDAYFSAYKFSNFFRQLLGEGALGYSFIPLYNDKVVESGEEEGKKFIFTVLNCVFIFSFFVSLGTIFLAEPIIEYTVRGFDTETKLLSIRMLKLMSFYFLFISLSGMIGAILNNFKQFIIPASTSIFLNIALIATTFLAKKKMNVDLLAIGVVVGGILQLIVVIPSFMKLMKTYSFRIDWKDPYLKKIAFLTGPMLIGIFARQFNTIIDQYFGSFLDSGGVSALENANRINLLPVGLFAIPLSTVIFPSLSKSISNNNKEEIRETIVKGLNVLLFLVIPCIILFTVYSKDVIRVSLTYGEFKEKDLIVTSDTLFYYSLGLYFYAAIQLITRAFYGMKDSKSPVKFSIIAIVVNVLLNFLLYKHLKHKGIAFATAAASAVNFLQLLFIFNKKYCTLEFTKMGIFMLKTLGACVIGIGITSLFSNSLLRLSVFIIAYFLIWAYPVYKKRMDIF